MSDVWDTFVAVDYRQNIPEETVEIEWLSEYLVPLSIYLKVHHWQNSQQERLSDISNRVDDASKTDWSLTDDFNIREIASEQEELRSLHDCWFDLHSNLINEQDEIKQLLSRSERSNTPGGSYEEVVNTPNKTGASVDNRSLFHRLTDEIYQEGNTITDRINQLDKRYQNVANYFSDRVQTGSTVLNTEHQVTNQRLQRSAMLLSVVLTIVSVIQFIDIIISFNNPFEMFSITIIICILLSIIGILIFDRI